MRITLTALTVALFAAPCSLFAENIFVNNATGLDRNDGSAAETVGTFAGPVRTISRALQLAKPSDAIVLANSGTPYFDEVTIDGRRLSGTEARPFRIVSLERWLCRRVRGKKLAATSGESGRTAKGIINW